MPKVSAYKALGAKSAGVRKTLAEAAGMEYKKGYIQEETQRKENVLGDVVATITHMEPTAQEIRAQRADAQTLSDMGDVLQDIRSDRYQTHLAKARSSASGFEEYGFEQEMAPDEVLSSKKIAEQAEERWDTEVEMFQRAEEKMREFRTKHAGLWQQGKSSSAPQGNPQSQYISGLQPDVR